jgi:hypothetical protein
MAEINTFILFDGVLFTTEAGAASLLRNGRIPGTDGVVTRIVSSKEFATMSAAIGGMRIPVPPEFENMGRVLQ